MAEHVIYDLLVVGGDLAACRAAAQAAANGAEVVQIVRETYLGQSVAGALAPYLPDACGSIPDAWQPVFADARRLRGGERAFSLAVFKCGLLDQLRAAGVRVIFATGIAGVVRDDTTPVGVVMANKSGLQCLYGRAIIDATEPQAVVALAGGSRRAPGDVHARYAIEYSGIRDLDALPSALAVPEALGLVDDAVEVHPVPGDEGLAVLRLSFPVDLREDTFAARNAAELRARALAVRLCRHLVDNEAAFANALLGRTALQVTLPAPAVSDLPARLISLPPVAWPTELAALDARATDAAAKAAAQEPLTELPERLHVDLGTTCCELARLHPEPAADRNFLDLSYSRLRLPSAELLRDMEPLDVCIAGGGTAGAAAALAAAGEGGRVACLEAAAAFGGTGCAGASTAITTAGAAA